MKRSSASQAAQALRDQGRLHVITLPRAIDRQRHVLRWCSSHGIGREIFRCAAEPHRNHCLISSSTPLAANPLTFSRYGRHHLQPSELGCQISHRNVYERIVKMSSPWALILEDDVEPRAPEWASAIIGLMTEIEASSLKNLSWVCHVGFTPAMHRTLALRAVAWKRQCGRRVLGAPSLGQLDPEIGQIWTTHAYLISAKAARAILEREPLGTYVADDWAIRLEKGVIQPMLATMAPLFVPNPSLPSQITERTEFSDCTTSFHDQKTSGDSPGQHHHLSIPYRMTRKLKSILYRAGFCPVLY